MSMSTCGCGKAIDTDEPETYAFNPKSGEHVCQGCVEEDNLRQCDSCNYILNDEEIMTKYKCRECGYEGEI